MEKKKFCEQISVMKMAGIVGGKGSLQPHPQGLLVFQYGGVQGRNEALFARFCFFSFLDPSVVFLFRDKPSATQQESSATWKPKYVYLDLLA